MESPTYWRILYTDPYTGEEHFENIHRFIYRQLVGPIPERFVIHHIDSDLTNNALENLVAMPKAAHSRLHRLHPGLRSPEAAAYYARNAVRQRANYHKYVADKRKARRRAKSATKNASTCT